jgi:hypothetical protein
MLPMGTIGLYGCFAGAGDTEWLTKMANLMPQIYAIRASTKQCCFWSAWRGTEPWVTWDVKITPTQPKK